ncbi:MAG: hypothetical protein ABIQ39_02575, partial [Ilumatobacteraceae bacterium]
MSAGGAQSHGTRAPAPIVGNVAVGEVYPLRRDVLRNGDPQAIVEFAEDRWPGVVHLAVFVGSSIVAVSTWIPRPLPAGSEASKRGLNAASAVQLRGMATAASHRGSGIGGVLV